MRKLLPRFIPAGNLLVGVHNREKQELLQLAQSIVGVRDYSGEFMYNSEQLDSILDQTFNFPQRVSQCIGPFWIDLEPVTYQDFFSVVLPLLEQCSSSFALDSLKYWQNYQKSTPYADDDFAKTVSYWESTLYCVAKGGQLPSWWQLSRAARGTDSTRSIIAKLANETDIRNSRSWCGVRHLLLTSGEWTSTPSHYSILRKNGIVDVKNFTGIFDILGSSDGLYSLSTHYRSSMRKRAFTQIRYNDVHFRCTYPQRG